MNWQTVFQCVRAFSGRTHDSPQAVMRLRREVVESTQLTPAEKQELHAVLDGLQKANLYGQISFVSRLKELLSRHAEFRAEYAEFGLRRD